MDISEARQVRWLRDYDRPLGELFDEGYLTRSRLEWAAAKAYDPKLREAAQLLLKLPPPRPQTPKTDKPEARAFDVGISLADARSKLWPFAPYKGEPMGSLVDSRQITFKDLGYAIDTAWDVSVRQSAMALLLHRLAQVVKEPAPSGGFVQVISGGRSHAERKQIQLTFVQGIISGVVLGGLLASASWLFRNIGSFTPSSASKVQLASPVGLIALAFSIAVVGIFAWLVLGLPELVDRQLQKQIDAYRLGQEGEDRAVQAIIQALDSSWRVFRNIGIPGWGRGDVDLVLVGPPGVWALEVKNLQGKYRNIGDRWEYWDKKAWKIAPAQPSQQARKSAGHLGAFLKADGMSAFVNAAVIWANPESGLEMENPSVAVWKLERLPDELGNLWQGKKLSDAERAKTTEKLTRLCERRLKDPKGV